MNILLQNLTFFHFDGEATLGESGHWGSVSIANLDEESLNDSNEFVYK